MGWGKREFDAGTRGPGLLCLLVGLLAAVPLVILTPPFQVPDEPQHFARAFQLSEGRLAGEVQYGVAGGMIPFSITRLTALFLGTVAIHADRTPPVRSLHDTLLIGSMSLDPGRRVFMDFRNAAADFPLPYLPQTLAIAAARWAGLGPLTMLYAARAANVVATIAILAAAISLLPVGAPAALLGGLLPMAVYEYASVSPDAMVTAAAFLFTALALRARQSAWSPRRLAAAVTAALIFCPVKPVYAPLLLLGLPAALRPDGRRQVLLVHALIVGVVLGVTLAWLGVAAPLSERNAPWADADRQLTYILGDPFEYVLVVARSFVRYSGLWFESTVGRLGWLVVRLPWFAYVLPVAGFAFCVAASGPAGRAVPRWWAVWDLLLVGACVFLVITATYLNFVEVGREAVGGVQGRYFLPLLAAFAAAASALIPPFVPWPRAAVAVAVCVVLAETAATWLTVVRVYGVF